jgi:hypothetical protein
MSADGWGEISGDDARLNDEALVNGGRLLSASRISFAATCA